MATKKSKLKKSEQYLSGSNEIEYPRNSDDVSKEETLIEIKPELSLPLKRVRLLRNLGKLKAGTVIDIVRIENDCLFFQFEDTEMYFAPSEINRLYTIVE